MFAGWKERKRVSPEERSTSLPFRRHPTVSKLEWEILAVGDVIRSGAHLRPALTQLERLLHASVNLLLPSTVEALRSQYSSALAESLLEDLLRYADAYGSLRMALLCVQDLCSEARAAVRRRDESTLDGIVSSLRRAQKEILSLVKLLPSSPSFKNTDHVAKTLGDVTSATSLVSNFVFHGVSDVVAAALPKSTSIWWRRLKSTPLRLSLLSEDLASRLAKRLQEMEENLLGLDKLTENVYRVLVNARVSLLNALTPL